MSYLSFARLCTLWFVHRAHEGRRSTPLKILALSLLAVAVAFPAVAEDTVPIKGAKKAALSATDHLEIKTGELEVQFSRLTDEVERLRFEVSGLRAQIDKINADVDMRLKALENPPASEKVPEVAPVPAPAVEGKPSPAAEAKSEAKPNAKSEAKPLSTKEQYDAAYALIGKKDYKKAEEALADFLQKYPSDELAGNASYWYAESFYVRGQYEKAAVAFADAYQKYPKSAKAADNFLKLGLAMQAMGKKDEACAAFLGLAAEYPKAAATVLARAGKEAEKLQCKKKK